MKISGIVKKLRQDVARENAKWYEDINARLRLVLLDDQEDNLMYARSIVRRARKLGIGVDVLAKLKGDDSFRESYFFTEKTPTLILESDDEDFEDLKDDMLKRGEDVEEGYQKHVVWATRLIIERALLENPDVLDKHVVILNRNKRLGLPLAEQLLKDDYTVTVLHSKRDSTPIPGNCIIVTATGGNLSLEDQREVLEKKNTLKIDLSYDLTTSQDEREQYKVIRNVGALTTDLLLIDVKKAWASKLPRELRQFKVKMTIDGREETGNVYANLVESQYPYVENMERAMFLPKTIKECAPSFEPVGAPEVNDLVASLVLDGENYSQAMSIQKAVKENLSFVFVDNEIISKLMR